MRNREHHPRIGIGLFFIVLGLALLIATNDLFNLGGINEYFTWQTAMIFIGVLMLVNLHFIGGVLLIAGGVWFMLDQIYFEVPRIVKTVYWPAVIVLMGLSFIVSSIVKRKKQ
jgi:hypothetical protein